MNSPESKLLVALGTTSEQKFRIVDHVLTTYHIPHQIISTPANSEITDQPLDVDTTILGAVNRCQSALNHTPKAKLAVGLEGGLSQYYNKGYLSLICVAALGIQDGELTIGISTGLPLPPPVSEAIISGQEFANAIRAYAQQASQEELQKWRVDDLIDRHFGFSQAITTALTYLYLQYYPQTPPGLPPNLAQQLLPNK